MLSNCPELLPSPFAGKEQGVRVGGVKLQSYSWTTAKARSVFRYRCAHGYAQLGGNPFLG